MDDFVISSVATYSFLPKLQEFIIIRLLVCDDNYVRNIYREISQVKTFGMLVDILKQLLKGEIKECAKYMDLDKIKKPTINVEPLKKKYINPFYSFSGSPKNWRLETLANIKKLKNESKFKNYTKAKP